ncbi:hypothetical protein F5B22DRAFT_290042 [Xylaria bambusicola]|uniref:uncharacterized protein n=1 Tax=Xylaria bambusicola TaxID=326684 RepID=UPI0020082ADE|nr:uncharacterized protein F5B22DRAFT_290042 [Xylaria bambusicola]KAI0512929.1 hypothetical protein F5B22DRAFT_290042 [Xylaria bambusicola]
MASMGTRFQQEQPDLEVVPPETGLYPLPTPPLAAATRESSPKEQPGGIGLDGTQPTLPQIESQTAKGSKRTILGLSVPVFWAVVVVLVILLAGAIGGGVGGGLSAQRKSVSDPKASSGNNSDSGDGNSNNGNSGDDNSSDSDSTTSSAVPTATPSPTSSSPTDSLVPTDGCPGVNNQVYTPFSADGKPIPIRAGQAPQKFQEQCWTNWANTDSTHDILRTYTPTLENCLSVCAEYNKAYATNLRNNVGVGGGFCVAITIVKEHAGFCYLKNGTGTNDTMGSPNSYSSALLLTSTE